MNNPINLTVFDSRDLVEYKEYLEEELTNDWNDWQEEHLNDEFKADDAEEVIKFAENLQNNGSNDFLSSWYSEIEHYENVRDFCEELEGYGDFQHGETIIHEDYFTEYCEELCEDIGHVSRDLPWYIANHIDWDGVASEIKQDYIEVEFEGSSYFMRA